jgi:hypothetical protein
MLLRHKDIPKRGGGTRRVYMPGPTEKRTLRLVAHDIDALIPPNDIMHGFRRGRSPVTNAAAHIDYRFTLTMDLADWFDSVEPSHLDRAGCPRHLAKLATMHGAARQGLPSSPAAANLAAWPMDQRIVAALPPGVRYTRYADDLTFSSDSLDDLRHVRDAIVPAAVAAMGWRINRRKTRMQDARVGRRIVTGVAIDGDRLVIPRRVRRRLRAAWFADPRGMRTRGLIEWAKLKPPSANPRPRRIERTAIDRATRLALHP